MEACITTLYWAPSPSINEIRCLVELEFTVAEDTIEFGFPSLRIRSAGLPKKLFLRLAQKMKPHGRMPFLRERECGLVIQVVLKPPSKSSMPLINFIFFGATLVTVTGKFP